MAKGFRSARGASVKGAKSRTDKQRSMRDSQKQNTRGTTYGGKLGDFMAKRNKKTVGSTLDKRKTRSEGVFSPEDVVAAAGRLAATDELRDQFGSKNAAAASFNNLINRQQQRLQDRFPDGARQFIESKDIFGRPLGTGKVTPAGANFMQRMFNEAAGFNPTRGMGILDSFRSNYEQSGAKFNRNQALRGILGSLIGGPLAGIALGNMPMPGEESEEGINEFGMPIYDGRQIDEYRTFGSAPAFDDALAFDPTNIAPMMRPNMPRSFVTNRSARGMRLPINTPRLTAGTAGVKFGQGSVPKSNRFGTAGSQFQNQRMLKQPLSKYGQVGKGQPFQTRSLSSDIRNFFTKNPFGKRTPLGLGLGALGLLTGMTGNTGEATESSGSFMDNLGDVFDPSSVMNQQPLFNFNPIEEFKNLFSSPEPASPAFDGNSIFEGQPYDPAFNDADDTSDRYMQEFPNRIFNV